MLAVLYVLFILSPWCAAQNITLSLQWTSQGRATFVPVDKYGGECHGLFTGHARIEE